MKLPSLFNSLNQDLINFDREWNNFLIPSVNRFNYWVEEGNTLTAEFDLPGLKKEDIKVRCEAGQLEIKAVREIKSSQKYFKKEYLQYVNLPEGTDENQVEVKYENGVLKFTVPKIENKTSSKFLEIK